MNPTRGELQPQFEQAPTPQGFEQQPDTAVEAPVAAPETSPGKTPPQVTAVPVDNPPLIPVPSPVTATSQSDDDDTATGTASATDTSGLPAADADRIEKQWVERAKVIVNQTQDDPHKQKSEMSRVKAEYIKKRYNKTVQVDDLGAS
ncbi:MAG: hypothetical protein WD887_02670 [Candidatus Saccharimonadales bacterium]